MTIQYAEGLEKRVDLRRVNLDALKPWIADKIAKLLATEDACKVPPDVAIDFCYKQLNIRNIMQNGKEMQENISTLIQGKPARLYMSELWPLLLSAQCSPMGIPMAMIEAKKREIVNREQNKNKITQIAKKLDEKVSQVNDIRKEEGIRKYNVNTENTNDSKKRKKSKSRSRSGSKSKRKRSPSKTKKSRSRSKSKKRSRSRSKSKKKKSRSRSRSKSPKAKKKRSRSRSKSKTKTEKVIKKKKSEKVKKKKEEKEKKKLKKKKPPKKKGKSEEKKKRKKKVKAESSSSSSSSDSSSSGSSSSDSSSESSDDEKKKKKRKVKKKKEIKKKKTKKKVEKAESDSVEVLSDDSAVSEAEIEEIQPEATPVNPTQPTNDQKPKSLDDLERKLRERAISSMKKKS